MKQFNKILCVLEPNKESEAALAQAVKIATDHQADLTVVSILNPASGLRRLFSNKSELNKNLEETLSAKYATLKDWVSQYDSKLNFSVDVFTGIGFIEIIKNVLKHEYDLVVKCADDVDWLDRLFGSDDMNLLRKCPCPVLMLKPGQKDVFKNVLATVDVNDDTDELDESRVQNELNKKVLEHSAIFSVSQLTELHIGSAWEAFGEDFLRYGAFSNMEDDKIDEYTEQARRDYSESLDALVKEMDNVVGKDTVNYLKPKVHLIKGRASEEIPKMVKDHDIDLIIMGTVARTGVPGFIIGNTAESILEQVQCSVLAIKPDGFITPVLSN